MEQIVFFTDKYKTIYRNARNGSEDVSSQRAYFKQD
jgi:hypothetical protein